jgi:hypothetical protein
LNDKSITITVLPSGFLAFALELYFLSSGEGHGLHLVLNLEQYEYMPGPQASAGVKLLAYDQTDVPRLQDMGVAIPAGSSALIGIMMNKV